MTFRSPAGAPAAALLFAALMAVPAYAQDDRVHMVNGTVVEGVRVTSFDVRNLKYTKGGASETVSTDQVARVELGKFTDVYRRGLKDPDLMLTVAREQLEAKNLLMAQLGFAGASAQFFDAGGDGPAKAMGAIDEVMKAIPEAGVAPELHRQKFEYYMGLGQKGLGNAATVAKKYQADATTQAWPAGFLVEAEFFQVLAERKDPKDYMAKLRAITGRAGGANPIIANRANVELAHTLRETKAVDEAMKIYEDVAKKDGGDQSARAGAYLGMGKILFERATANDKDAFMKAMLLFLRVRLETTEAWPGLHAEALYCAILAADKWRGPEYTLVMARCRNTLTSEFPSSEWAERIKSGR